MRVLRHGRINKTKYVPKNITVKIQNNKDKDKMLRDMKTKRYTNCK